MTKRGKMAYIRRQIEDDLKRLFNSYKVILVTGARQVGKTSLIQELFGDIKYINFDNVFYENEATEDGLLFLNNNGKPLMLDEVQRVPELFRFIKYKCDESNESGQYVLSGSQLFKLMSEASDSLSGRVHIVELPTLSLRELKGENYNKHFVPCEEFFNDRMNNLKNNTIDLWDVIHRGMYPEMHSSDKEFINFYSDYVKTYVERDVREIVEVKNLKDFQKFLIAVANRTGEVLNVSNIASELRRDEKTISNWISVLETSGIIYLLMPYENSELKRMIKKPKLYFRDTGLASFLTRWNTKETLMNGAMNGHMFETFVVSEILKTYANAGLDYSKYLYYYRGRGDKDKESEIDLIIEENGVIYPIEIKMTTKPSVDMISACRVLKKIENKKLGSAAIICNVEQVSKIAETVYAVPVLTI